MSGVEGGAPPGAEPDPTVLERVRDGVDAKARDGAYVGQVHRAVMAEVDPVLAVRVDSVEERAEADLRRLRPGVPLVSTKSRLHRWFDAAPVVLLIISVLVLIATDEGRVDAPAWVATAAFATFGVSVVGILVSGYLEGGRKRAIKAALAAREGDVDRADAQLEAAELRAERELETLFAQVPPDRATRARSLELALLREGYESGRVSERQVRDALPIIDWHWPTAR